jgi:hypothetical protein
MIWYLVGFVDHGMVGDGVRALPKPFGPSPIILPDRGFETDMEETGLPVGGACRSA